MTIIDIHVHPPGPDLPPVEFRDIANRMIQAGCKAGIDKQVFMGWISQKSDEQVRELLDLYPGEVIGFVRGWCSDPTSPQTVEKYVRDYGFKGIKLHDEGSWPLSGILGCHPLFLKAQVLDIPVLIHTFHEEEGLSADVHNGLASGTAHFPVQVMAELGKSFPDVNFIFAHAGMMWIKAFQAAQPYPNLHFDVSGFDPESGIVEQAVATLGAERVLFGSDALGRAYAAQLAKVQKEYPGTWFDRMAREQLPVYIQTSLVDMRHHPGYCLVQETAITEVAQGVQKYISNTFFISGAKHFRSRAAELMDTAPGDNYVLVTDGLGGPFDGIGGLVDQIGGNRVLFGSRTPILYTEAAKMVVEQSTIAAEDREKIFHKNAARLLALR
ncbi:MAG: amidohydrolase family protein [Anaerolineae bacterium]|nr:amidohydrolase family protein [Anaerolineae bacterium]